MKIKLLEIRDRATCMPAFAFQPSEAAECDPVARFYADKYLKARTAFVESFLVRRTGYPTGNTAIILGLLNEPDVCGNDPHAWGDRGARTLPVAHKYIEEHWDEIVSGDVIDVEFILKETKECKVSEAFDQ